MTFAVGDQQELFLPLIEGVCETPPWGLFLRNLVARTYARRAFLIVTLANAMSTQAPMILHASAPRAAGEPPLDLERIASLGLHPYGTLRPGRVYAIDDMLDFSDRARLGAQREALDAMGIRYGRWLRITAGGVAEASILLVREREDFSSRAVAVLSALGPHLAAALRTLVALSGQRLQVAMAQAALARLGVGQIALDETARVMAADAQAERLLSFTTPPDGRPGRRLQLPTGAAAELEQACAALAAGHGDSPRLIRIDAGSGQTLLLRPCDFPVPDGCARPAVIGVLRTDAREDERNGQRALRALHDLSEREAALAEKLSRGETITGAGRALRLTDETARNYSKRIYAKTGARGQADLVRTVLTGLAPLA